MKKLFFTLLFGFGFALTMQSQTLKFSDKAIDAEQQATKDVNEITKLVEVEEYLVEDLKTLQVMRYQAINDASDLDTKVAINKRFATKILGAFSDDQLAKLNTKPDLYNRIFVY